MKTQDIVSHFLRGLQSQMVLVDIGAQELAAQVGFSPQKMTRLLNGGTLFKLPALLDVCEILGVDAGELLTRAIERARMERKPSAGEFAEAGMP